MSARIRRVFFTNWDDSCKWLCFAYGQVLKSHPRLVAVSGSLPHDTFSSERMMQVLDLCLECKSCKSECPANVDMANVGGGAVIEPGRQPAGYCSVASSSVASVRRCERWCSICSSRASKSTGLVT